MNEHEPITDERTVAGVTRIADGDHTGTAQQPQSASTEHLRPWQKFVLIFKVVEVRLRFIAILVAVGLFVGYWDTIKNHWEKQTRSDGGVYRLVGAVLSQGTAQRLWPQGMGAESPDSDSEYYCPMHPSVVRAGLDPDGAVPKCPICGMPLSLRKKGEALKLPAGVLSRKQFSPEQVQLAGVKTVPVTFRALTKEITMVGHVGFDESRRSQIVTRVAGFLEKLYVNKPWVFVKEGEPLAEIYSPELYVAARELLITTERGTLPELGNGGRERLRLWGISDTEIDEIFKSRQANHRLMLRSPRTGHVVRKDVLEGAHVEAGQMLFEVADLSRVWIEAEVYEADIGFLREGQDVKATVEAFPGHVFGAKISLVHPYVDSATRTIAVRFEVENPDHKLSPGMFATVRTETPIREIEPFATLAAEPATLLTQEGEVLAVPERSVINTGSKKIVYVEREPGMFEGVEVALGPRSGGFYPVISGLAPNDRVAERGSFLIDAETRLNPAAAATYIGASGGPQGGKSTTAAPSGAPSTSQDDQNHDARKEPSSELSAEALKNIAALAPEDHDRATAQGTCPISGQPLGSMGVPHKMIVNGEAVFLCCQGCEPEVQKDPNKVLKKLAEGKAARENKGR